MSDTGWVVAGDGYRYLRRVGNMFLDVRFTWQGCGWEALRVCPDDYHRFGRGRTLRLAKAAAMRVARRWNEEADHE